MSRSIFTTRHYGCDLCGTVTKRLAWNYDPAPECCGQLTTEISDGGSPAPNVIGDDIPGGLVVRHLSWEPQTFYSKSAIREAARQRGWTINGETPKPPDGGWRE